MSRFWDVCVECVRGAWNFATDHPFITLMGISTIVGASRKSDDTRHCHLHRASEDEAASHRLRVTFTDIDTGEQYGKSYTCSDTLYDIIDNASR